MTKSITPLVYHNMLLVMKAESDIDRYKIETYERSVKNREIPFNLKAFTEWCRNQNIDYDAKFYWRKDYPLSANIWNFYTVTRWRIENMLCKQ